MSEKPSTEQVEETEAAPIQSQDAETLEEEPRNLLLALVSEIRIGMDLSRITLPTFILEPRSMLEKLTDFMTHGELLALVPKMEDPADRIVGIVKWYLSGFYIKPQGVKKPYNPLLGEFFRCKWVHGDNSTSHYVAEQVSHHPPISCFYASNRREGFIVNGTMNPRSKFLGTSVASIMDGTACVHILPYNEEYTITFPSVYGRGILFGTLLMELVGVVTIQCKQTGCKADIDFKAKPFFGGEYNNIQGKVKRNKDTLYTISGKWDGRLEIVQNKKKNADTFFDPKGAVRIPKIIPPVEDQQEFESQRLWANVSVAIKKKDQKEATAEKTKLEDGQRARVKERKETGEEWEPRLFRREGDGWVYKYTNVAPYNPSEGEEEEQDGIIFSTGVGKEQTIKDATERAAKAAADRSVLSASGGLGKGKSNGKK